MDTNDENTAPVTDAANDYDAAFLEAAGESAPAPASAPVEPESPEGSDDVIPAQDVDAPAEDGPANPQEPAPTEPPKPQEPAPVEPPKPTEAPSQAPLDPKHLAEAIAEAQAQATKRQQAPTTPAEPAAPKTLTAADFLQPQDVAAIDKFKVEWPDEHAAIQKLFQAEMQALVGNRFNEYTKQLNGVLAPVLKSVQGVEVNTYRGAVTAAHPDAFDIGPKVAEWIATQPALVRGAYQAAFEGSDPQAAIELLNLYKTANGTTGAAPATPASSAAQEPPQKPKPAPNPANVRALAAVPAAQRPKPTGTDVNDFDGAFAEAAEQLANS